MWTTLLEWTAMKEFQVEIEKSLMYSIYNKNAQRRCYNSRIGSLTHTFCSVRSIETFITANHSDKKSKKERYKEEQEAILYLKDKKATF
jgi:hypothetical protein